MTFDKRTDLASATNVFNYWIRSNAEQPIPPGMATEGMDWELTDSNSVRPYIATITPVDNSKMRYLMTFKFNAISGLLHVVLSCFVNLEGMTGLLVKPYKLRRNLHGILCYCRTRCEFICRRY